MYTTVVAAPPLLLLMLLVGVCVALGDDDWIHDAKSRKTLFNNNSSQLLFDPPQHRGATVRVSIGEVRINWATHIERSIPLPFLSTAVRTRLAVNILHQAFPTVPRGYFELVLPTEFNEKVRLGLAQINAALHLRALSITEFTCAADAQQRHQCDALDYVYHSIPTSWQEAAASALARVFSAQVRERFLPASLSRTAEELYEQARGACAQRREADTSREIYNIEQDGLSFAGIPSWSRE
jgi:hypothetical protein